MQEEKGSIQARPKAKPSQPKCRGIFKQGALCLSLISGLFLYQHYAYLENTHMYVCTYTYTHKSALLFSKEF